MLENTILYTRFFCIAVTKAGIKSAKTILRHVMRASPSRINRKPTACVNNFFTNFRAPHCVFQQP